MTAQVSGKQRWQRFIYFFPLRLLILHVQRSLFTLIFWLILFGLATESFATKFGVPYLFLAPEYRGEVDVWSYGILGFALGGFIMSFNIYTYIRNAHRFPFLGTLARPFYKFCINNSIIPLAFIVVYIYCASGFLKESELKSNMQILSDMLAFLLGNALFIVVAFLYFFPTNKNIYKITGQSEEEIEKVLKKRNVTLRRNYRWYIGGRHEMKWRVDTYLSNPFRVALARDSSHYDVSTLRKVFYQNHVNASFFELIIIAAFVVVGAFQFKPFFVIPAAASTFLVMTAIIMIVSILMSWLKDWTFPVIIVLIALFNSASTHIDLLNMANPAYGLNYDVGKVPYTMNTIDSLNSNLQLVRQDMDYHEQILDRWLDQERKLKADPAYKPMMVLVNTSGGGQRSTLFTLQCLQRCDSITNGAFFRNTRMLTGSSGGTIGSAYFRELYLQRDSLKRSLYSQHYLDNASKDLLNRILYTLATNDVFVRFRHKEIAGQRYVLDRAMTFEDQLNRNTEWVLDKTVSDYEEAVHRAQIPMMVLAPSVVNDGRRILISSQPISYLCYEYPDVKEQLNLGFENIEFNRMFAAQGADNLLLTSALRMNSTFPYVLPYASLPTEPVIEVMDAGLRDNFGSKITAQYLYTFKHWIEKNTRGVLILQVRDVEKRFEPSGSEHSILEKLVNPIGSFYGNFFNDQDYNMDQLMRMTSSVIDIPIHQVPLEIMRYPDETIALSWHLSALEKQRVLQSLDFDNNQRSLARIQALLSD
jgi:hypothetical protein